MSKERLIECDNCENKDVEGDSCVLPGTAPCCKLCGCCLHLATRSLSYTCKAGKWPTLFSEKDSVDISIVLNFKEKLDKLLEDKKVSLNEHNTLLSEITSENSHVSLNARYKIRFLA